MSAMLVPSSAEHDNNAQSRFNAAFNCARFGPATVYRAAYRRTETMMVAIMVGTRIVACLYPEAPPH